jgi:hypothetical protein
VIHFCDSICRFPISPLSCQIRGKKHKDTICIVVSDENVEKSKIRMSKVVRTNLRVRLGDIVSLHSIDVPYGAKIKVLPIDDTIEVCLVLALFLRCSCPSLFSDVSLLMFLFYRLAFFFCFLPCSCFHSFVFVLLIPFLCFSLLIFYRWLLCFLPFIVFVLLFPFLCFLLLVSFLVPCFSPGRV